MDCGLLLSTLISVHLNDDFEGEDITEFLASLDGPHQIPFHVLGIKDEGNQLFKKGDYGNAFSLYANDIKLMPKAEDHEFCELVQSLHLNLAACSLKLYNYDEAKHACSFILDFFPNNVKALYRRALAYKELRKLSKAKVDLEKAIVLAPNNGDVKRELKVIEKLQEVSSEIGKLSASECVREGKRKKVEFSISHMEDVSHVCSKPMSPSITMEEEVGDNFINVPVPTLGTKENDSKMSLADGISPRQVNNEGCSNGNWSCHKQSIKLQDSTMAKDAGQQSADMEMDSETNNVSAPKGVRKYAFAHHKNPHKILRISTTELRKLQQGQELTYFNPRSMSFMRIHTSTQTEHISNEALRECSWEAAASNISDTSLSADDHDSYKAHSIQNSSTADEQSSLTSDLMETHPYITTDTSLLTKVVMPMQDAEAPMTTFHFTSSKRYMANSIARFPSKHKKGKKQFVFCRVFQEVKRKEVPSLTLDECGCCRKK